MPDVAIVDRSVAAAPKDYLLPSGQEILLKAVRASFDGSGAATGYRPALQLVAPDGTVMWTAQYDTDVAAGASAVASWFPGVKPAAAATPTSSFSPIFGYAFHSFTVAAGVGTNTYVDFASFFIPSSSTSYFKSMADTDGHGVTTLGFLKQGTYKSFIAAQGVPASGTSPFIDHDLNLDFAVQFGTPYFDTDTHRLGGFIFEMTGGGSSYSFPIAPAIWITNAQATSWTCTLSWYVEWVSDEWQELIP